MDKEADMPRMIQGRVGTKRRAKSSFAKCRKSKGCAKAGLIDPACAHAEIVLYVAHKAGVNLNGLGRTLKRIAGRTDKLSVLKSMGIKG